MPLAWSVSIITRPSLVTTSTLGPENERSPIAGFFGLVRMSSTGAKSSVMPTAFSSSASAFANRAASFSACPFSALPSAAIGGHRVNGSREPRDAAALLIDADPQGLLVGQFLRRIRDLGDLLGRFDVALEQDDAAQVELAGQRAHFRRDLEAIKAADEELSDVAADVTSRHVEPNVTAVVTGSVTIIIA